MRRLTSLATALGAVSLALASTASAQDGSTLNKIDDTGTISIGMREAARPFAYVDQKGEHVGFSIDLARLMVSKLEERIGKSIKVEEVTVTPKTRVPLVANGTVDVEAGSSTHTAPREEVVDFSIPYFLSQTTFIVRGGDGIDSLDDLNGRIVGSARGTTNLRALQTLVDAGSLKPENVVIVETHAEGFLALQTKKLDAYFTDTSLLTGLKATADNPDNYKIVLESIHDEPYGWIVRENDSNWRDFVNHFLVWTLQTPCSDTLPSLREHDIVSDCGGNATIFDAVYDKWMGPDSKTSIPRTAGYNALLKGIQWPGVNEVWPKSGS